MLCGTCRAEGNGGDDDWLAVTEDGGAGCPARVIEGGILPGRSLVGALVEVFPVGFLWDDDRGVLSPLEWKSDGIDAAPFEAVDAPIGGVIHGRPPW